ncbi:MAG: lipase family protein [Gammaproteobacteria bacterium]|nr:lipase family protein [Gammaproteobacteria bacterium]
MARIYAYDDTAQSLFHPAAGKRSADFFEDWTPADSARMPLLAAELARLVYAAPEIVREALPRAGLALHTWIGGDGLVARLKASGTEGFVATDGAGHAWVVFRGTEASKPEDLLADLMTAQTPWPGGGNVHRGFATAYGRVRDRLLAALAATGAREISFTGHSLGAALATLAAVERGAGSRLVTFGSPRIGDTAFAAHCNGVFHTRVVGCCDLVTRVPPPDFSPAALEALLMPLYPGDGAAVATLAQAAALVSTTLLRPLADPRFVHVGNLAYVDRDGRTCDASDEDAIRRDQETARAEYAARHRASTPPRSFATWFTSGSFAEFFAQSCAVLANGTVPLRDLADHAPINYVGAMARRSDG